MSFFIMLWSFIHGSHIKKWCLKWCLKPFLMRHILLQLVYKIEQKNGVFPHLGKTCRAFVVVLESCLVAFELH